MLCNNFSHIGIPINTKTTIHLFVNDIIYSGELILSVPFETLAILEDLIFILAHYHKLLAQPSGDTTTATVVITVAITAVVTSSTKLLTLLWLYGHR